VTEPQDAPAPPPEPREPRRSPGLLVLGAVIAAVGIAWLLAAVGALDVPLLAGLAIGLMVVGLALVLAPRGAHVGPVIVLGIVLALLGGSAAAIGVDPVSGGAGERVHRPGSAGELDRDHELGLGRLELDLTRLDPEELGGTIEASVGIGELVVLLPDRAEYEVDAAVGIGEARALELSDAGWGVRLRGRSDDEPPLRLELEVGIGSVRVVQG
jgi:hypothetical protein